MLGKLLPCLLLSHLCFYSTVLSWPSLENQHRKFSQPQHYEGSSDLVNLVYHMGPVLTSPVNLYIIWYGHWNPTQQSILMDFLLSLSSYSLSFPSVANWWQTARLYTDQTGANVTGNIVLAGAHSDSGYSQGRYLSRLAIQSVIKAATIAYPQALPVDPENGLYLVLTSADVRVEDFCRAVCGFHYFTFPSIVGMTVPYAWVGYSGDQCPEMCAFPFAMPKYGGRSTRSSTTTTTTQESSNEAMGSPNGDIGADGMVSVIAHELAEMATNPLINAWYAGDDPTAPDEIADMCVGVYGSGGGGGYVGMVSRDSQGRGFNVNGVRGRKFLVQWVWNPIRGSCYGPNALD